jgi:formyl-CoA transferase
LMLSDSPVEVQPSPLLGEHTEEILTGLLGYDRAAVDQLHAAGVI